ncbi:hypothetical protein J6590_029233 [Homalodisca vitripennis]|nr:hypothetical protein J6590_029233 [Homalodisca vitripennis]
MGQHREKRETETERGENRHDNNSHAHTYAVPGTGTGATTGKRTMTDEYTAKHSAQRCPAICSGD